MKDLYLATGRKAIRSIADGGDGGFDATAWLKRLKAVVRPYVEWLMADGAVTEWRLHGPRDIRSAKDGVDKRKPWRPGQRHPEWMELPEEVRDAIEDGAEELLDKPYWNDVAETVRSDIADALSKGTQEGDTNKQKAERIEEILGPAGSERRANLIARTESTGLLNRGHQEVRDQLQGMGIVKAKEWLGVMDDSIRPSHEEANGQQVGNDEPFQVGDETCDYPGDPELSAEQRCGCRCTAISILADDEAGQEG